MAIRGRSRGSSVREAADKGAREWPCLSVRGARVRPDSAITAARESARRKNKSFAQYTGVLVSGRPYRLGLEPQFFAPAGRMRHPQGVRTDSLLDRFLITSNLEGT